MSGKRKDDFGGRSHFRAPSRVFMDGGLWYFSTREGGFEGPFANKAHAESMLEAYVRVMSSRFAGTEFELVDVEAQPTAKRAVFTLAVKD